MSQGSRHKHATQTGAHHTRGGGGGGGGEYNVYACLHLADIEEPTIINFFGSPLFSRNEGVHNFLSRLLACCELKRILIMSVSRTNSSSYLFCAFNLFVLHISVVYMEMFMKIFFWGGSTC